MAENPPSYGSNIPGHRDTDPDLASIVPPGETVCFNAFQSQHDAYTTMTANLM